MTRIIKTDVKNDGDYFDLSDFHRPITTSSPEAQLWFDRGLVWSYGFNRSEAVACFRKAIEADSDCAIAYWALAYALGPYYNQSWEHFGEREIHSVLSQTHKAANDADARSHQASPVEQALIKAIKARYPSDKRPANGFKEWNQAYADAMEAAYKDFGKDLDVAALCAESLMVMTPWALWDPMTGKPSPGARTYDAKAVIERAFAADERDHPGLLHLYIHLMEMSREPETALTAADRLRNLIPEAGHLNHMPSHIDVLVGDYRRAIEANTVAIRADNKYAKKVGEFNPYTIYRAHDIHTLIYAAMLAAKSSEALSYSLMLEKALPEVFLRKSSNADWTETFHSVRPHVMIRFGMWKEILALPMPDDEILFSVTTATLHYAKGVAWAATGHIKEAETEQQKFAKAADRVPESRFDFPNRAVDVLPVAEAMLAGEIEYRKGNVEVAFRHLRKSVELDDGLGYSEPWSWMQPTRHALGALLMEQGRYEEAVPVYEADLGLDQSLPRGHQHPNNVWALVGYHECLVSLGRKAEARLLELPLAAARQLADVDIPSSCFCKKGDTCCKSETAGTPRVQTKL